MVEDSLKQIIESNKPIRFKYMNKTFSVKTLNRDYVTINKRNAVAYLVSVSINGSKPKSLYLFYKPGRKSLKTLIGYGLLTPNNKKGDFTVLYFPESFNEAKKINLFKMILLSTINPKYFKKLARSGYFEQKELFEFMDIDPDTMYKFSLLVTILSGLLAVMYFAQKIYTEVKLVTAVLKAEQVEKKMLEQTYSHIKDLSLFDDYITLIKGIQTLIQSKNRNGLLIYGPPGTGKTFVTRLVLYKLNQKYKYVRGSTGGQVLIDSLIKLLFNNSKDLLLLDDFDDVLANQQAINIMKAATETTEKRIITAPRSDKLSQDTTVTVPEKFVFEGKIILITNKEKDEIDRALISRMGGINIRFTSDQMVKIFKKMIDIISPEVDKKIKEEVLNYLVYLKNKHGNKIRIDFRTFKTGIDLRLIEPENWKTNLEKLLIQ